MPVVESVAGQRACVTLPPDRQFGWYGHRWWRDLLFVRAHCAWYTGREWRRL